LAISDCGMMSVFPQMSILFNLQSTIRVLQLR